MNFGIVIMRLFSWLLLTSLLAVSVAAQAKHTTTTSPYVVLENVGEHLFTRIASNQQQIKKFPKLMNVIVEEELMPSIDYKYAAYRILGKHLKKTTKEQRKQFVIAMRSYLARTYAAALKQYKNQQVIFEQDKPTKNKSIVAIRTQIVEMNKPTINMVFKMRKNKKTGQWKAFDMVVEGISLLSSKQAELSKRIAKEGVEQVAIELAAVAKS